MLVELLADVAGTTVEVVADVDAAVGGSAVAYHVRMGWEAPGVGYGDLEGDFSAGNLSLVVEWVACFLISEVLF